MEEENTAIKDETIDLGGRQYLTVKGLAEFLQRHPKTIRRWVREKHLSHIKIGSLILFDATELMKPL